MLEWLKENSKMASEKLGNEMAKFRNRTFMEALLAGCALLTASGGGATPAQREKMLGFIKGSEELGVFNFIEIERYFDSIFQRFEFDERIGQAEALKSIGRINGDSIQSRLLVRVCMAIASTDGEFDSKQKSACKMICLELGLDVQNFGL